MQSMIAALIFSGLLAFLFSQTSKDIGLYRATNEGGVAGWLTLLAMIATSFGIALMV